MTGLLKLGIAGALIMAIGASTPVTGQVTTSSRGRDADRATGRESSQKYAIDMTRRLRVGQRMLVQGQGGQKRSVVATFDGIERQLEAISLSITFDGEAEVLEIDRQGRPTRVEYTISRCVSKSNDYEQVIAPKGSVLIARRGPAGSVYEIDGRALGLSATSALELVIPVARPGATDDEVFGSRTPRRVGETWSIDSAKAIEALKGESDEPVSPGSLTGTTTFGSIKQRHGLPCLVLRSEIVSEGMIPGLGSFPSNLEVQSSSLSASFTGFYPVDESLPVLSDSRRMDMSAVLKGRMGTEQALVEMRVTAFQMSDVQIMPIDGAEAITSAESTKVSTQN